MKMIMIKTWRHNFYFSRKCRKKFMVKLKVTSSIQVGEI